MASQYNIPSSGNQSTALIGRTPAQVIVNSIQLLFLLSVVWFFKFESDSYLPKLLPLIFIGYVIHEVLPFRFRLSFFLALGIISLFLVTGVITGTITLLLGLTFIGIAHLRVKNIFRIILAVVTTAFLALVHLNAVYIPELASAIPFVASMFMFRFILYLYERKHEKQPVPLGLQLSYFFMLPNICLPLFPIVDYKTFNRSYYSVPYLKIQSDALRKIFRGTLHLLVYRFLYLHMVPSPAEIHDLLSFLQYIVFSYLLILRLSGLFHFALGVVSLFGFSLPEIFNNYFLASSFSDLWRRINIYWREFMIKIFFQPIWFRIKKFTGELALPVTVLIVFAFNWFMHNYQWFWLHGGFALKATDILFWMVFGVTVMLNSVYQARKQRATSTEVSWSFVTSALKVLRIFGMFIFMCFLWSLWCSTSLAEWRYLASFVNVFQTKDLLLLASIILLLWVSGIAIDYLFSSGKAQLALRPFTDPNRGVVFVYSAVLFITTLPALNQHISEDRGNFITHLQEDKFNKADRAMMERGYYQKLLNNDGGISKEFWKSNAGKKKEWTQNNQAIVNVNNILVAELLPSMHVEFKGAYISTNKWGMRDKDYPREKGNAYRMMLMGGSYEMGSGVPDGMNFESLVEERLNSSSFNSKHNKFEILNLAVGGYHVFQGLKVCESRALPFQPDAVIYAAHSQEWYRASRKLSELISKKIDLEYPFLKRVVEFAGVKSQMCDIEIEKRLKPFMPCIVKWTYQQMALTCRNKGIVPIWLYVPAIDESMEDAELRAITEAASSAGFVTCSLENVYRDRNLDSIKLSSWDNHPNINGHRLIADKLYRQLIERSTQLHF